MKNLFKMNLIIMLVVLSLSNGCTEKTVVPVLPAPEVITDKNWQFETTPVWEDDFNSNGAPDPAKWVLETGGSGWGNNELQNYTASGNANKVGGNLEITAKKESSGGRNYSSARMITKGKAEWLYGRFEVRAKLPRGRGTWPAIWMLHANPTYGQWPASGEIDIMEHVGFDPNKVHFSVHTAAFNHSIGTQKSTNKIIPTAIDEFHTYTLDWTPYAVRGYIDGSLYFEFTNANQGFAKWPFDIKFFMILNVAVGGNWGGAQGVDDTVFPATMSVDYVRVYKMIPQ